MNRFVRAALAGALGSITTNLLHEIVRRTLPDPPRVDLLGMQAIAQTAEAVEIAPPLGRDLYLTALGADLVSNAAYFALTALAPRRTSLPCGIGIGLVAGAGAVALPGPLGLSARTTSRTTLTSGLTVALYTAGGLVAGLVLQDSREDAADAAFFAHKNVAITGGTRGLGFVLAQLLLAAGANVTICGRSGDALDRAVGLLDPAGQTLTGVVCDVRDRAQCERFIADSLERHGSLDILINNAGVIEVGPLVEQTIDDYREAMDTHFWGPFHTTSAVLPTMRARGHGSIVNIASVGGVIGVPHLAPYCASKFAQVGFSQALAAEAGADGVCVTSVTPGLMITGSPDHAIFKGRNQAEYAWFTLSDANPLIAVPVDRAARAILRGIRLGRNQVTIGWTAHLVRIVNALFPNTTTTLLGLAARLLPAAGGIGTQRRTGQESRSAWTQNPLTALNARAKRRTNNETPPPPAQPDHP